MYLVYTSKRQVWTDISFKWKLMFLISIFYCRHNKTNNKNLTTCLVLIKKKNMLWYEKVIEVQEIIMNKQGRELNHSLQSGSVLCIIEAHCYTWLLKGPIQWKHNTESSPLAIPFPPVISSVGCEEGCNHDIQALTGEGPAAALTWVGLSRHTRLHPVLETTVQCKRSRNEYITKLVRGCLSFSYINAQIFIYKNCKFMLLFLNLEIV